MNDWTYPDGRPYNPPANPLAEKWSKLYPPSTMPQFSQVCDVYSCMWCERCPMGEYWKTPEEDKLVYEQWLQELDRYHAENGSITEVLIPFNIPDSI